MRMSMRYADLHLPPTPVISIIPSILFLRSMLRPLPTSFTFRALRTATTTVKYLARMADLFTHPTLPASSSHSYNTTTRACHSPTAQRRGQQRNNHTPFLLRRPCHAWSETWRGRACSATRGVASVLSGRRLRCLISVRGHNHNNTVARWSARSVTLS